MSRNRYWTPEERSRAADLWRDGKSAGQIAAIMGVSRGAVMGQIKRMGLSIKKAGQFSKSLLGPTTGSDRIRNGQAKAIKMDSPNTVAGGLPLAEITAKGCRFAVSPHDAPVHLFCGLPAAPGRPYCPAHRDICYAPAKSPLEISEA